MHKRTCDVLIIGAGMGGNMLARQLKIQMPDLNIVNIDGRKKFDYWIGESTVEVWADYAYRCCKLGPYLQKHQTLKHGLRFFFDTEKKDLSLTEMSEGGRSAYPGPPKDIIPHQIDRATFDQDLCDMNRESGIEVLLGCRVLLGPDGKPDIKIDRNKGHVIQTSEGPIHCRYLVDAGGRTSPLGAKLNLIAPDPRHTVGSAWVRLTGFKNIDDLEGKPEWKKRINHTMRYLSTNHFMYRGHWFWHIAITDKILSLGVSYDKKICPLRFKNAQELLKFMRERKCFRELFPESTTKALDFMTFQDCTMRSKQIFSEDRWFMTGMSAFVLDALFSTTGITLSWANRCIGEMIKTDRMGNEKLFKKQVNHCEMFMQMEYERYLSLMQRYNEVGSYEAWQGWRPAHYFNYVNVAIPQSNEDLKTMFDKIKSHKDDCGCSFEKKLEEYNNSYGFHIHRLNREFVAYLQKKGRYYQYNKGEFVDMIPPHDLVNKFYEPRCLDREKMEERMLWEQLMRYFLVRLCKHEKVAWNEQAFMAWFNPCWTSEQTLAMGLKALKTAKPSRKAPMSEDVVWTPRGPYDREGHEISATRLYQMRNQAQACSTSGKSVIVAMAAAVNGKKTNRTTATAPASSTRSKNGKTTKMRTAAKPIAKNGKTTKMRTTNGASARSQTGKSGKVRALARTKRV